MSEYSDAINRIYDERKNFIIIGLTGRTASGSSTVAELLCKPFSEIGIHDIASPSTNEERKKRVIYNYAKCNWKEFKLIEVRNIITSFILEYDLETFTKYIDTQIKMTNINRGHIIDRIMEEKSFCDEYEKFHNLRIDIKNRLEKDNSEGNYDISLACDDIYDFYFELLPKFTLKIKDVLSKIHKDLYFNLYQSIGRNIRKSGNAYKDEFVPDNIYIMPQRINKMIKILRRRNLKDKKGVRIVIDSLKNPYEISFFKDRYSSFYCFAIYTDEKSRRDRLLNKMSLSPEDISRIDQNEYDEKISDEEKFYAQSVPSCYQIADVHILNEHEDSHVPDLKNLKWNLIKYVTLIMHPGIITPSHIERCMNYAYIAKLNSGCLSRSVGAAVTNKNFSILSTGWNSVPEGQVSCNLRIINDLVERKNKDDFSKYELENEEFSKKVKDKFERNIKNNDFGGRSFFFCFKDFKDKKNQVHTRSLHAEENAFLQLVKNGTSELKNAKLFTTASPCVLCSKKAYQLGIEEIYFIDQYPDISEEHILNQGAKKPSMILFTGVIGNAYYKLYHQIAPMKDELYLLSGIKFSQDSNDK